MPKNRVPKKVLDKAKERCESKISQVLVCEAMIKGSCGYIATDFHHRKMRSQGGGHDIQNCLMVCRSCHNAIHADPATAYENGWLVRGFDEPGARLVLRRGVWAELTEEGGYRHGNG